MAQNVVLHTEQVNQVAAVKKDLQSKMSHLCDENVSSQLFVTSHYTDIVYDHHQRVHIFMRRAASL